MRILARTSHSVAVLALAFAIIGGDMSVPATSASAAASPFSALGGVWSGAGRITLTNGRTERLRCRAYYNPKAGGRRLGLAIRCASANNRIELRSQLLYTSGQISGSWVERTFNASGSVSGRARSGRITMTVIGTIRGSMHISYSGRRQSVLIRARGSELSRVTISLGR